MNRFTYFVLLLLFWVLLTWPADFSWSEYRQDLIVGAVAALFVALLLGKRGEGELRRWLQPKRYGWAVVYVFVLAAYIVKANFEVAYRVLHPAMPVRPGLVKVKTRLHSNAARAVLSNSITLTPGTLTVDIDDAGVMLVHWIYVRTTDEQEAAEQIIGRFEWYIEKIME